MYGTHFDTPVRFTSDTTFTLVNIPDMGEVIRVTLPAHVYLFTVVSVSLASALPEPLRILERVPSS